VTVTTGARFALDPGAGRAAVPVRSALVGTTLSVLAVTAAFTFGASLLQTVQQSTCVVGDQRPNGVTNFARIDGIPEVLALLLAVLGVAVLGQMMVVSGRRRRRDLATLKTLGLVRRQVQATVAWQATILTGHALLAGLPLGVAVGRWAWALFSSGLGIPPGALIPVPFVLLMIPAAMLAANAVAYWPARAAARLSPARVLRAE